VIYSANQYLY